ncbi:two-component sensor histidine kinase [Gordonia desulfuricans]|uniref:histidine kinase n=1 Tax=Gordonia desulfuricans TaxID=89051 RepID=A0A7K3LT13_9ACTN|nr:histidine kinase [Gordonia desulfuricans]NDK91352.1 two-component sensor histidine kinase [Gordonia desulfuricans]
MLRRWTRAGWRAVSAELRDTPLARHPGVRAYLRSPLNWFFLVFATVLFIVSWGTMSMTHAVPGYVMPVTAALASVPLAFAWAAPLPAWTVSAVSALVIGVVTSTANGWPWQIQVTHIIAFLILTFMAFLRCPLRLLLPWWVCSVAVMVLSAPAEARFGWAFGLTALAVVTGLLRGLLFSRRQLAVQTAETRVAESTAAVLAERTRIARDLHDVVAHRMSMVVVMAQTARYRLPDVSVAAAEEFDAIADAARTSLDEVRQLLGVLRVEGSAVASAPNPGLGEIDSLISQTRRAGAQVAFTDGLDHAVFGEASALVIYRIVQESLANATRHAPGGAITVELAADNRTNAGDPAAQVMVYNAAGTEPPLGLGGAGVGVPGMIDRAGAVGGTVTAAPAGDGGFVVRAWIPSGGGRGAVTATGSDAGGPGAIPSGAEAAAVADDAR